MKGKWRLVLPIVILSFAILGSVYGGIRWYDANVDRSGWVEEDGVRYYRDFHAKPFQGWLELPEGTYYLKDGIPTTGWLQQEADAYHFGLDGRMTTGWLTENGKTYYFGSNGHLVRGWLWLGADRYYLDDGVMLTGWQTVDGSRMYFGKDGILLLGFQTIDNKDYYFGDTGAMAIGPTEIDGQRYLFGDDGQMFVGWQDTAEGRRFYTPQGPMALGWLEMDDGLRYFDQDGFMATGWLAIGEYDSFFSPEGIAATGPTTIDGELHYFTPKGQEVILVNALNPLPRYFENQLVSINQDHQVDVRCYDALMQMLSDCNAAGIEYTFNSAYRTRKTQTLILEYRTEEYMKKYNISFEEARTKALETVAIPDTSEHQLGLAVDLLGKEAIAWFQEHCWDYGFILRYPDGKQNITGIADEAWHFRYVGIPVAQDIRDSGLCLEEYLGATHVTPERKREAAADYMKQPEAPVKPTELPPEQTEPPQTESSEPEATQPPETTAPPETTVPPETQDTIPDAA